MVKNPKLTPSLIVTQANQLIEARYNLPLGEQRLILTMISRIQPTDEDFKEYRISVKEFAEFMGIASNSLYKEFHKIQKSIVSRVLVFYEEDGPLVVGWVSSAKYLQNEGSVLLSFDPKLKPYLLQLKGNFTSSKLEMLLTFKSQYTIRIYNLLRQYELLKEREFDIDVLRDIVGIKREQYNPYSQFKQWVIKPVQRELKEKADLYFEFDEIKYGRKVGAIRFRIITKNSVKTTPEITSETNTIIQSSPEPQISTFLANLIQLVPEQHRAKKTVLKALESFEQKHGFDYVKRNILYCNTKADKSYVGFLHSALKNDWGQDWELDQKTSIKKKVKPKEVWEQLGYKSEQEYAQDMFDKQMKKYGGKL